MKEKIILVDKNDKEIGIGEKLSAHQKGELHRAFSIFIFSSEGKLLVQKRNNDKHHSGGLWTNTVCSHPRPGESLLEAAHRRLKEEMGFDCPLNEVCKFHYKSSFENGLTENEIDYVFVGKCNKNPEINKQEVSDFKWESIEKLIKDTLKNPEEYSYWFKKILENNEILEKFKNKLVENCKGVK